MACMEFYLKQISPCTGDPLIISLDSNTKEIGRSAIPALEQYTQISRRHAKITKINHGEWVIEDLNSMNGVFVEHKLIGKRGKRKLNVGDTIGFGVSNVGDPLGLVCIFMVKLKEVKNEPIEIVTLSDDENEINKSSNSNISQVDTTTGVDATPNASSNILPTPRFSFLSETSTGATSNKSTLKKNAAVSSAKVMTSHNDIDNENNLPPNVVSQVDISKGTAATHTSNLNTLSSHKRSSLAEISSVTNDLTSSCLSSNSTALKESTVKNNNVTSNNLSSDKTVALSNEDNNCENSSSSKFFGQSISSKETDKTLRLLNVSSPNFSSVSNLNRSKSAISNNISSSPSSSPDKSTVKSLQQLPNKCITKTIRDSEDSSNRCLVTSDLDEDDTKLIKECAVHLVKCDSSSFNLPADVKKPAILKRTLSDSVKEKNTKKQRNDYHNESENFQTNNSLTNRRDFNAKLPNVTFVADERLNNKMDDDNRFENIDDNIGYSQVEEVICISDDDSYLDFTSSQPIKLEPVDDEDEDFRILDELPEENDIEIEFDSGANSESIEAIHNFMEHAELSTVNIKVEKGDSSDLENLHKTPLNTESATNAIEETYNSNPSREFDCHPNTLEKGSDYEQNSERRKFKDSNSSSFIDKFDKRKLNSNVKSKLKMTDPLPIKRRGRRLRGREEWFEPSEEDGSSEKSESLGNTNNFKADISNSSKRKQKYVSSPSSVKSSNKSKLPTEKSRCKHINSKDEMHLTKKEKLRMIELKRVEQAALNAQPVFKKPAPVKKRNDNFGSRSQFLTALPSEVEVVAKPSTSNQNKKELKSKPLGKRAMNNVLSSSNSVSKNNLASKNVPAGHHPAMKGSSVSNGTANKNITNDSNVKMVNNKAFSSSASSKEQSISKSSGFDPRLNKKQFRHQPKDKDIQVPKWNQDKTNAPIAVVSEILNSSKENHKNVIRQTVNAHDLSRSALPKHPPTVKISFYTVLEKIVGLNVKWILEQKKQPLPPPDVSKGAIELPLYFESYEHYISVFQPMLMLEIWEELCKEAQPILNSIKDKVLNKFYFSIKGFRNVNNFSVYECESLINSHSPRPLEGTLVILEIKTVESRISPILGYINNYQIVNASRAEKPSEWNNVDPQWTRNADLWKFSIFAKIRSLSPKLGEIMKGNVVFSIKNKLRLADALKSLQSSPLCRCILRPDQRICSVDYPSATHTSRDFSPSQKVVIEGVSEELSKPKQESKMILLQGPPGTGKTHTIVGLLDSLIFSNAVSNKKILVVAPSNAAIDEIGCRLIDFNEKVSYTKRQIRFVRIGLDKNMNTKMKPYFLDEKAISFYDEERKKSERYKKLELDEKLKKIKKLQEEMKRHPSYQKKKTIDSLLLQYKNIEEEKRNKATDKTIKQIKMNILKDCNVILSTLGSCCQGMMISAFHNGFISFSACIIDEATQCTEIEILQPLTFNISKLILVGDHNQLPATVSSQLALRKNFDRSMFERFYMYFSDKSVNPVFMLTEQFRMHSEICRFPSKFFYDGKLITVPDNDIRYRHFPVYPYIVYDILDSQETNCASSKTNCNEARAIASLCTELIRLESNATIGIITPYQAQVKLYRDTLHHNPGYKNIEINTVDSFQGREKDIIIVSCVRANSSSGGIGFLSCRKRLNVAITRARHCLIVCIHSRTLEICDYWKDLINDARKRRCFATVPTSKDMPQIFYETLRKRL
ncbi:uncharacterized protein [Parasteatoda tepidariorum]|uniref:uncharacterized protein n=1 Tax=Parasteatoda tepidariorum TaxID=114398 RepID=UPI00077FAE19|nr:uncharacterized protein LOC107452516 [Parasteatoda tepidariorum]